MLRRRVAKTLAIHMPQVPSLARQDRLVAPGTLVEARATAGASAFRLARCAWAYRARYGFRFQRRFLVPH